jgi:hypothetical protein
MGILLEGGQLGVGSTLNCPHLAHPHYLGLGPLREPQAPPPPLFSLTKY